MRGDERVVGHGVVGGHGTDDEVIALLAHLLQLGDPTQVDEQVRVGHPHPQHRHQRLPTTHDGGLAPAVGEAAHHLLDAGG